MKAILQLILFGSIMGGLVLSQSCKHEPIIPPGYPDPNDTTGTNPNDTTGTDPAQDGVPCDPDTVYFENDILPLLSSTCAISGCHDAATAEDGVQLTDYFNIISTGDVRAIEPDKSDLYEVITETDPDKVMPRPSSGLTLTQEQKNMIYDWIMQGAKNNGCNEDYGKCDTTNMSFANDIQPIINLNCLGCHSGSNVSGGVELDDHPGVHTVALSGQLLGAITHSQGYKPMPNGQPKLPDCKIAKIRNWINDGAQNN